MNWLHYLIEANIYLGVFYLCYCLFLNNETHYTLGRFYLLFSCVLSFVLPLTQLNILKPEEIMIEEPVVLPGTARYVAPVTQHAPVAVAEPITMQDIIFYFYIAGVIIALLVFAIRIYRLSLLARRGGSVYADKYKMIRLDGNNTAFSFFNYLFIGNNIPKAETIIAHEMVHIRQKHSADIIFIELLKVVNWFNPLIYLLQRSLRTVHEYIADEHTAAYEQDALSYSSFLVNNAYGVQGSPIAHSFFNYNLLKKRIIMLNQKRSGNLARLKYLLAVPLCAGMLCASTLVFSKDYGYIGIGPRKGIEKPETVKYLKITDTANNITAYSDNLSFTENGVKKIYLANSITVADIAFIKTARKVKVEVIDVDSHTKLPVTAANTPAPNADTPKYKRPVPPPPIMVKDGFDAVHQYISRAIQYPKDALMKEEKGNALISFDVNASGKIRNVTILQKAGGKFDDLLLNTLPKFPGTLHVKPGTYKMEVVFDILGGPFVTKFDNQSKNASNFAGQAHVLGMTDAQRRKLLPPPPPPAPPKKVGVKAPKEIEIVPPAVEPKYSGSIQPPPPPPPAIKAKPKAKAKAAPKPVLIPEPEVSIIPVLKLSPVTDTVNTQLSGNRKNEISIKLKEVALAPIKLKPVKADKKIQLKLEKLEEVRILPDTVRTPKQ